MTNNVRFEILKSIGNFETEAATILFDRILRVLCRSGIAELLVEKIIYARRNLQGVEEIMAEKRDIRDEEVVHIVSTKGLPLARILLFNSKKNLVL